MMWWEGRYIQTMTTVFELGGDLVQPEVANNLMRLIAEGAWVGGVLPSVCGCMSVCGVRACVVCVRVCVCASAVRMCVCLWVHVCTM
jgi:hypothetical protein